ncbi:MAG: hypothetical protein HRU20_19890 [Pseudomonadales bacterium]|nr:hypothetical protein [Pseudomonadales bacterium]
MDTVLAWLLYCLASLAFFLSWYGLTSFLKDPWFKALLRYPVLGLLFTSVSMLPALSQRPLLEMLLHEFAPAVVVLIFTLLEQGISACVSVLTILLLGIWLAVMVGLTLLFLPVKS